MSKPHANRILSLLDPAPIWTTRAQLAAKLGRPNATLNTHDIEQLEQLFQDGSVAKRLRPDAGSKVIFEYYNLKGTRRPRRETIYFVMREYFDGAWRTAEDIGQVLDPDKRIRDLILQVIGQECTPTACTREQIAAAIRKADADIDILDNDRAYFFDLVDDGLVVEQNGVNGIARYERAPATAKAARPSDAAQLRDLSNAMVREHFASADRGHMLSLLNNGFIETQWDDQLGAVVFRSVPR